MAKRLIDAEITEKIMNERYKELAAEYGHYDAYTTGYGDALCVIEEAPTVEAVEVVRCKDCKVEAMCNITQRLGENGFCSYGERTLQNERKRTAD